MIQPPFREEPWKGFAKVLFDQLAGSTCRDAEVEGEFGETGGRLKLPFQKLNDARFAVGEGGGVFVVLSQFAFNQIDREVEKRFNPGYAGLVQTGKVFPRIFSFAERLGFFGKKARHQRLGDAVAAPRSGEKHPGCLALMPYGEGRFDKAGMTLFPDHPGVVTRSLPDFDLVKQLAAAQLGGFDGHAGWASMAEPGRIDPGKNPVGVVVCGKGNAQKVFQLIEHGFYGKHA